jgi:hypothetical protein
VLNQVFALRGFNVRSISNSRLYANRNRSPKFLQSVVHEIIVPAQIRAFPPNRAVFPPKTGAEQ